jgi:serine protease SohB
MASKSLFTRLAARLRPVLPAALRVEIPIVPVVRLSGPIGIASPFGRSLSLQGVARTLERAFRVKDAAAVALVINSPGGSAVQSHLIYRRIRALAEEHERQVLVFVEDAAASGGYMIACAGDVIIADQSSIVGSVGVIGAFFGFDRLIERLGVERRVYTAGDRKNVLDAFLPEDPDEVKRIEKIQKDIHQGFIALVRERRGHKLTGSDKVLFSGEFWTARRGLELGFVDELGDLRSFLRERFGEDVETPLVEASRGPFGLPLPGASRQEAGALAGGVGQGLLAVLEERALWGRLGL